jgi:hypothetical protein
VQAARFIDHHHAFTQHTAMQTTAAQPRIDRPSLALFGAEPWRAAIEFAAHKLVRPRHAAAGDGHPVVIFPGLASNGKAVAPLRRHCAALGYNAFDWGQGFNTGPKGDVQTWLQQLAEHVADRLSGFDQSATFIGWSLGGLYARELAKLLPAQVRQVITIGTPFNASADHTRVGWLYQLLAGSKPPFDSALNKRLPIAPDLPTTSIYSRSDGIVAWQTCLHDRTTGQVQDIEIAGSHSGMGWNAAALHIIADRLALPAGRWRPYTGATAIG